MKMGFLFTGAFWGFFLVLIGVSVLVRVFFNIDFPIVRVFFGLFIIAVGVNILLGRGYSYNDESNVIFGEGQFKTIENNGKYNVIFGSGVTDLTGLKKDAGGKVEINTIFGENRVLVKKGVPFIARASSAFGQIDLPDGNNAVFGSYTYTSPEYKSDKPFLQLELNTVFGSTKVRFKD